MSEEMAKPRRGRPPRPAGKKLVHRVAIKLDDAQWNGLMRRCRECWQSPAELARWALEIFVVGFSGHPIFLSFSDEDWRWLKRIAKKAHTDDMNGLIMGAVQDFIEIEKTK